MILEDKLSIIGCQASLLRNSSTLKLEVAGKICAMVWEDKKRKCTLSRITYLISICKFVYKSFTNNDTLNRSLGSLKGLQEMFQLLSVIKRTMKLSVGHQ